MYDREGSFVLFWRGSLFVFMLSHSTFDLTPVQQRVCRGLSCVCAQLRDSGIHSTFDLTPAQVTQFSPLLLTAPYLCIWYKTLGPIPTLLESVSAMKPPRQNVWGTRRVTRSMTSPQQISLPIPDELVFEIFSRLPSKVIARCRCVCKLWSSMLCSQDFIQSFLTKSCACPQILFSCEAKFDICFWSVPQPQNLEGDSSAVAAANHLAPFRRYTRFLGCTNGLFVCGFEGLKNDSKFVTVICNPSTGQSLTLPRLKSRTRYEVETYLGYDPIAKEYKVLSMAFSRVNNVIHLCGPPVVFCTTKPAHHAYLVWSISWSLWSFVLI
ncbi:unnamed protein product [Brassica oleracea]